MVVILRHFTKKRDLGANYVNLTEATCRVFLQTHRALLPLIFPEKNDNIFSLFVQQVHAQPSQQQLSSC